MASLCDTSSRQLLVLIDNSGSTANVSLYWTLVRKYVMENPTARFFLWNSTCSEVTKEAALYSCDHRIGVGGTYPLCFLNVLKEGDSIFLITDGGVDVASVQQCVGKSPSLNHVIYACIGSQANLSVGAPFTDVAQTYMVSHNDEVIICGSGVKDIELNFKNPEEFLAASNDLRKEVTMQCLVGPKPNLRRRLLALSEKMQRMCALENTSSAAKPMECLVGAIDACIQCGSSCSENPQSVASIDVLPLLQRVVLPLGDSDLSQGARVQNIFNHLFQICDGCNSFSLDSLKSRVDRAAVVAPVPVSAMPLPDEEFSGAFQCPMGLFPDHPVIYVRAGAAVFAEYSKADMEYYLNNPLAVLTNDALIHRIRDRIDGMFGFSMAQKCFEMGDYRSPVSRMPIVGFISSIFDKNHQAGTNYTLSQLFFGGKLVGCTDLWLAVMLLACESIPYIADQADAVTHFILLLRERMRSSSTNMTLSGLPILPQMRCRTDIAVLHCLWSPFIPQIDNRVRYFGRSVYHWVKLGNWLQLPMREADLKQLMRYYECFSWMMSSEKENKPWRDYVRARYQNHTTLSNGRIVFLDAFVSTLPDVQCITVTVPCEEPHAMMHLSTEEVVALARLVNRTKTSSAIEIPFPLPMICIPAPVVNYPNYVYGRRIDISICPATMRPYIVDRIKHKPWNVASEEVAGPLKGLGHQLSVNKYLLLYVEQKSAFPTAEELCEFMFEREQFRESNPVDTLPLEVMRFIDEVLVRYYKLPSIGVGFRNITPVEFNRITMRSTSMAMRAAMEEEG